MKGLAHFSSEKIDVIREVTDEEYDNIAKHISQIHLFEKSNKPLENIIRIRIDIFEAAKTNDNNKLIRLISELMSAFRSFLDYWETYLKREYGKESHNIKMFKDATSKEYDNEFAYRFIYELRNYIQHIGIPDIALTSKIDSNDEFHYSLKFDRNKLLESGHNWKPAVKNDLLNENCEQDILLLLPQIEKSLNRINITAINNFDISVLIYSCKEILKYKQIKKERMELAVLEFPPNYPKEINGSVSVTVFPFFIADYFLKGVVVKHGT